MFTHRIEPLEDIREGDGEPDVGRIDEVLHVEQHEVHAKRRHEELLQELEDFLPPVVEEVDDQVVPKVGVLRQAPGDELRAELLHLRCRRRRRRRQFFRPLRLLRPLHLLDRLFRLDRLGLLGLLDLLFRFESDAAAVAGGGGRAASCRWGWGRWRCRARLKRGGRKRRCCGLGLFRFVGLGFFRGGARALFLGQEVGDAGL